MKLSRDVDLILLRMSPSQSRWDTRACVLLCSPTVWCKASKRAFQVWPERQRFFVSLLPITLPCSYTSSLPTSSLSGFGIRCACPLSRSIYYVFFHYPNRWLFFPQRCCLCVRVVAWYEYFLPRARTATHGKTIMLPAAVSGVESVYYTDSRAFTVIDALGMAFLTGEYPYSDW